MSSALIPAPARQLALLAQGRQALAEARTITEAKDIRDKAQAVEHYLRQRVDGEDAALDAAELKLWAERRLGELLAAEGERRGGNLNFHGGSSSPLPNGVTHTASHRWRRIWSLPEPTFIEHLAEGRERREITTASVLRLASKKHTPDPANDSPLPDAKARCLVVDPPWPVEKIEREKRPKQWGHLDYPTKPLDWIETKLKEAVENAINPKGCHVYLWVTQKFLPAGLALFEAAGVRYQCLLTWVKPTGMTPYSWMYNTEHVLFGRVGSLSLKKLGLKLSFEAPVNRHSAKPDVFYERVIEASPEPRLEMFQRTPRPGFIGWGNEVPA